MKSEHRHELQTNELGKITEKLTAFMEVHGNRLMIGVCVASLVASAIIYWVRTQRNSDASAWRELASAVATNKPDEFFDVWNGHQGTAVGLWARVHEGEARLGIGVQALFRNLDKGLEDVKGARVAFKTVVDDRRSPKEVRERALFGLGRALESLSEPDDAVQAYETLVKEFKDSIYKNDAEERIAILKKDGKEFYAWFSTYERPKPIEKLPHDKIGDDLSDEDKALFEELKKKSDSKTPDPDDGEPLTIPDLTQPHKDPDEGAPSKKKDKSADEDDEKSDSKSKLESKTEPDDAKEPAAESKPDES